MTHKFNFHFILDTGTNGNQWSQVAIRVALAIFSQSPSAFSAVKELGIYNYQESMMKLSVNILLHTASISQSE
jgi:hypothetical protein